MDVCDESQEIVKTIIALAQSLNFEVVAEGIESRGQLACLQKLSCEFGQGYYFAKPTVAANIEHLIAQQPKTAPARTIESQSAAQVQTALV